LGRGLIFQNLTWEHSSLLWQGLICGKKFDNLGWD